MYLTEAMCESVGFPFKAFNEATKAWNFLHVKKLMSETRSLYVCTLLARKHLLGAQLWPFVENALIMVRRVARRSGQT